MGMTVHDFTLSQIETFFKPLLFFFFQTEICQDCFFIENYKEDYNSYQSKVNPSWYLALRRSGQAKYGPKTNPRQRAVNFLIKELER